MSSAFIREGDDMWLHEVKPTLEALVAYLTRENGGLRITERSSRYSTELAAQVHRMSDGFSYAIKDNKWVIVDA